MAEYTESGYTESGYTEGDESGTVPASCDLSGVMDALMALNQKIVVMQNDIDGIKAEVNSLNNCDLSQVQSLLDTIENAVSQTNTVALEVNNKCLAIQQDALTVQDIVDNTVTIEDIKSAAAVVDEFGLRAIPVGTSVLVSGSFDGVCEVVGSKYLPLDEYRYALVYTVQDSLGKRSDFLSIDVSVSTEG